MLNDINIGGVYLPGLLVIALVSLACTVTGAAFLFQQALLPFALPPADWFIHVYRHFFPAPAGF
jgi:hypothetical protein